mmetsp:Transcript_13510/g.20500  ORF Transcript_13510/g.20500 Transcript_13510/m.20500 type:complete len:205 (-) Transcript_13510:1278-1892(-)
MKPHRISRLTMTLAAVIPPVFSPVLLSIFSIMAFGTTVCATVDNASNTMPPIWNVCIAIACAVAATPVLSIDCVTRVTAKNVKFKAKFRNCKAAPPRSNGDKFAHLGRRNNFDGVIIFLLHNSIVNMNADVISAAKVAKAAPVTPNFNVKIKMGSKIAFNKLANRLIFNGVTVSITPLKAENPIKENIDGRNAKPRIKRYGLAN